MNQELLNNKNLRELLSNLHEGETTDTGRDQPLGKYGRMAMDYLYNTNLQRFTVLKMTGELTDMMYRVDDEASEAVEALIQKMLEKDPLPKTDDILEKTRHFNTKRSIAEELVINETVLIPR